LLRHADTADLMGRAHDERLRRHGTTTFFTHSLNLNPTNVCENRCELCAFWREPEAADAYVLSLEQVRDRLRAARTRGFTDLHVVGGLHAGLDLEYHEALFRLARESLPGVLIQGLTAVEIHALARRAGLDLTTTLRRLRAAGLDALPGGGAEIFSEAIRRRICSRKITADEWLTVHEQAHALGIPSNATLLFGHLESDEDIIQHLARLRALQDRTGGFQAFIALPFHPRGARLPVPHGPGGYTVTRVVALARIFLDNVPHMRALVNYVDRKLLQVLLHSGVDDIGGTSLDERIARAAGAPPGQCFATVEEMTAFIQALGFTPALVNSVYQPALAPASPRVPTPPSPASGVVAREPAARTPAAWARILARAARGERLSAAEALVLHDEAPLHALGPAARRRRAALVPGRLGTFIMDRNLSITNVCTAGCRFCAFHVPPGAPEAFTLTEEAIVRQAVDAARQGATQVLLQGGLNPGLTLAFYERVLAAIKREVTVCLHSLSPAEVTDLARRSGLTVKATLERLRRAGLDSLPGGGAEILVEDIRRQVSPGKPSAAEWFAAMEAAHELGMKSTATMVYGLGESGAQRVEHLVRLRALQDRTGGFTAFIPWSFQPNRTRWPRPPASGVDYLRIVALSRLVLDNIPHLQAGWVTEGPALAQLALAFGADDFGGVLMEEKVIRATGTSHALARDQVVEWIAETGLTPAQRDTQYAILKVFSATDALSCGPEMES
jgi:dehypoxanthine futalosine cyclase